MSQPDDQTSSSPRFWGVASSVGDGSPKSPKNIRKSIELWVDCRDQSILESAPLGCDRRLIQNGANATMGSRDLLCNQNLVCQLDEQAIGFICSGAGIERQASELDLTWPVEWCVLSCNKSSLNAASFLNLRNYCNRIAAILTCPEELAEWEAVLPQIDALVMSTSSPHFSILWQQALQLRMGSKTTESLAATVRGGFLLPASADLVPASVISIDSVEGLADRVCIDFIQTLKEGEGLLVGSTSKALCFVHAQTAQVGRMPARPFRVSAGPVHAHVALPDGRTKYLSDVDAGDQILVVDVATPSATTRSRSATVGRCQVEASPVICIRLRFNGSDSQVFFRDEPGCPPPRT